MVLACSPQQDTTTLHFPSPSGLRHLDATSTLIQLRRSLSRSPSKSPAFRLVAGKHNPSQTTPLSPSPLSQYRSIDRAVLVSTSVLKDRSGPLPPAPSPLGTDFPANFRGTKTGLRKFSPLRPNSRIPTTVKPSSAKRVLCESNTSGNSMPFSNHKDAVTHKAGATKSKQADSVLEVPMVTFKGFTPPDSADLAASLTDRMQPPQSSFSFRSEKQNTYLSGNPAKSSPLKRVDAPTKTDGPGTTSPSAKRRSLHGASDLNIFDQYAASEASKKTQASPEAVSSLKPDSSSLLAQFSKRSGSLRKSTIQQRHDRPVLSRSKANGNLAYEFSKPTSTTPVRKGSESSRASLPTRRNLFANEQQVDEPSSLGSQAPAGMPRAPTRHPLSRTITQSSSGSDVAQDSPTHVPMRAPPRKTFATFARSLPIGLDRATVSLADSSVTVPSERLLETPDNYKFAKPPQAMFHSTGLISKRSKDLHAESDAMPNNMPDTPCKRPMPANPMAPSATPAPPPRHAQLRRNFHAFGAPSSPFNPATNRPTPGANGQGVGIFGSAVKTLNRRGSFLSVDSDDNISDSLVSQVFELPATPSKSAVHQATSDFLLPTSALDIRGSDNYAANDTDTVAGSPKPPTHSSPLFERVSQKSPHTPKENHDGVAPPDPSGLSISANGAQNVDFRQSFLGRSNSLGMAPPATPTTNRESSRFHSNRLVQSSAHAIAEAEHDPSLTSRFDNIEMIGDGEFSAVFKVARKAEGAAFGRSRSVAPGPPTLGPSSLTDVSKPRQFYAVKRSRNAYLGIKDRTHKLKEVEVLRAMGSSQHTVELLDHWEFDSHLYIQTEFCDEGSLDKFLIEAGRKARLDDFRIWKILIEIGKGLMHVHAQGYIHLDLKPANILVAFDGTLKIADFGMATCWPAAPGVEAEGDREYIAPEILTGRVEKAADLFALGLIVFEIAGNVVLPDNGASWQRLRQGDISDAPSLTSVPDAAVQRDARGNPIEDGDDLHFSGTDAGSDSVSAMPSGSQAQYLLSPPEFMADASHPQSLENIVTWMINPVPEMRPTVDELLGTDCCVWVEQRRRAAATIYEGTWGPAIESCAMDTEMTDV